MKNKVPRTVDIKIQKEFPVKILMVTLTLLLLHPLPEHRLRQSSLFTATSAVSLCPYIFVTNYFFAIVDYKSVFGCSSVLRRRF